MSIEFNAKITSTTQTTSSTSSAASSSVSSSNTQNYWWWLYYARQEMSASWSNRAESKSSNTEEREFSIYVSVKATQEEMPAGMRKVLDILVRGCLGMLVLGYIMQHLVTTTTACAKRTGAAAGGALAGVTRARQHQSFERMHTLYFRLLGRMCMPAC